MEKNTSTFRIANLNYVAIKKARLALRAINHPQRKKIVEAIESQSGINVTALYKKLRLTQSLCSFQLNILRQAGIIIADVRGRNVHYSVNGKRIAAIKAIAEKLE